MQRLTKEEGEANRSPVETTIPLDFVPVRFHLTDYYLVLESQLLHKIINMLFTIIH